jgi:hypothetical protein
LNPLVITLVGDPVPWACVQGGPLESALNHLAEQEAAMRRLYEAHGGNAEELDCSVLGRARHRPEPGFGRACLGKGTWADLWDDVKRVL